MPLKSVTSKKAIKKLSLFFVLIAFLETFIDMGKDLDPVNDSKIWTCLYLHKVMFNMDILYDEAKHFVNIQSSFLKAIVLPQGLVESDFLGILKVRKRDLTSGYKVEFKFVMNFKHSYIFFRVSFSECMQDKHQCVLYA